MALEKLIEDLIAALNANTTAHSKLADVAIAAAAEKTTKAAAEAPAKKAPAKKAEADEEDEEPKKAPAKKTAEKAPAKKAPAKKKGPELVLKVKEDQIADIAVGFMSTDDEEEREERKTKMRSALQHLGFKKATEIDNAEDRAKFASYLAFWAAGEDVDFEDIDEKIADALGGSDAEDEDEDDDMV